MPPVRIDASHFSPDTQDFLRLLYAHDVRYIIAGGEAVIYHGHARLTGDVDVFYDREPDNASRLFAALLEFWDDDVPGVQSAEELTHPGLIIQFGVPPNRIDLLNEIDGVSFEDAWTTRTDANLVSDRGDVRLRYIGLDALIRNKEKAGRPKDLEDLAYLRKARERRR